jgi:hypothetical protein
MKLPFYESMTRVMLPGGTTLRVWRSESELKSDNEDIRVLAQSLRHHAPEDVIEAVSRVPRVAAVEWTDAMGNGFVVYTDW